ncbi:hypothetical protein NQ318_003102, partial [Aromia moschata]
VICIWRALGALRRPRSARIKNACSGELLRLLGSLRGVFPNESIQTTTLRPSPISILLFETSSLSTSLEVGKFILPCFVCSSL